MGVSQIKEELLKNAEIESSFARKDAEKQAREILAAAEEKAENMRKQVLESSQKQAGQEHRKMLEAAAFESTTSLLKAKKEIMDAAIGKAKAQLAQIPAETRKRHLLALLEKAKQDISVEHAMCSKKDMPFITVEGLNVEESNISGGLIAENKERTMRVDLSYDTLFASVVEESMPQVYAALFESDPSEKAVKASKKSEDSKEAEKESLEKGSKPKITRAKK
jgi:vacuolar-type H+-ATPase subunit E/Vma4